MGKFQGCVTFNHRLNKTRFSIKSVIAGILFFVFLIIMFCCLVFLKKIEKVYDKQTFYVVYVDKSRKKQPSDKVSLLKNLGGASEIIFHKDYYYLCASYYLSENDASQVVESMSQTYVEAGILKLEAKNISKKTIQKISANISYERYFKYMYQIFDEYYKIAMGYMSGSFTDSEILQKLYKKRLELVEIIENLENKQNEKIFNDIKTYAKYTLTCFDDLTKDFYQSTKKEHLICLLGIRLVEIKVDLFNNL